MDSAFAKLNRARRHLAELQDEIDEHRSRDHTNDDFELDLRDHKVDDSLCVVTIRLKPRMAPLEWSLIGGDVLTNLRAALDHALFGHAAARQQLNSAQRGALNYPIFLGPHGWFPTPAVVRDGVVVKKGKVGRRAELAELIEPAVLERVEAAQPFQMTDYPPVEHPFAVLSALVNRDKHRAIHQVPINVADLILERIDAEVVQTGPVTEAADGAITTRAIVRRPLRAAGAEPSDVLVNFRAVSAYLEEIEIPQVDERKPFLNVMELLVKMVAAHLDELKAAGC